MTGTDAERALWRLLRQRPGGAKFRRQHPMAGYVLDFFCVEKRLAIEAEGGQHLTEEGLRADAQRTRDLEARGLRALLFTDRELRGGACGHRGGARLVLSQRQPSP